MWGIRCRVVKDRLFSSPPDGVAPLDGPPDGPSSRPALRQQIDVKNALLRPGSAHNTSRKSSSTTCARRDGACCLHESVLSWVAGSVVSFANQVIIPTPHEARDMQITIAPSTPLHRRRPTAMPSHNVQTTYALYMCKRTLSWNTAGPSNQYDICQQTSTSIVVPTSLVARKRD